MPHEFVKYPKIYRLGKLETETIFDTQTMTVQEKLDGANVSIWPDSFGNIRCGSRNQEVTTFRGFPEYIRCHQEFQHFFAQYPDTRLFGEWLVPHTVTYAPEHLNHFYLFSVFKGTGPAAPPAQVQEIAQKYNMKTPSCVTIPDPTIDKIMPYVGRSNLTAVPDTGEGVVITNGSGLQAKIVTEAFSERRTTPPTSSNNSWENVFTGQFVTTARVQKVMHKLFSQTEETLERKHTKAIIEMVWRDVVTEEALEIAEKPNTPFDFKLFRANVRDETKKIFFNLLARSA